MNYTENLWAGNEYRDEYIDGIHKFITARKEACNAQRAEFAEKILDDVDVYRQKFADMLGYPLNQPFDENDLPNVKKVFVAESDGIKIYRVQIEAIDELWFYGILFVKEDGAKRPFVIASHGGGGMPEICSSFVHSGNYNDMVKRTLEYDVNIFVPQLLLWTPVHVGVDYDRERIDSVLKQTGGSITALEIYAIRKSINYFVKEDYVDSGRIGMLGLSYGGHYTLYTTAVETRIRAALSSSFFNDRLSERDMNYFRLRPTYYHGRPDWTWFDSASTFLDGEIALLSYPRYLKVVSGSRDEAFRADDFKRVLENTKAIIKRKGKDTGWFDGELFDGNHEFPRDDKYIAEFIAKLKE